MALQNLTDTFVRQLGPAKSTITWVWDNSPRGRGLGVYVTKAGAKSFIFRYKHEGKERRLVLGAADPRSNLSPGDARRDWEQWLRPGERPALNVATARAFAALVRDRVAAGKDPLQDRKDTLAGFRAYASAPTVNDLADKYLEWAPAHKRPRTVDEDRLLIDQHIRCERVRDGKTVKRYPHRFCIGRMKVADVTTKHITKLHDEVVHDFKTPIRASLLIALLSKAFNLSVEWGWREGPNPCKGIERARPAERKRYLDPETELPRLTATLTRFADRDGVNALRLLMLTGARRGEVLKATWAQFDVAAGRWTKPASTTKQKAEHVTYLSRQATQLLRRMEQEAERGPERATVLERQAAAETDPAKRGKLLTDARLARVRHDAWKEQSFLFPSIRKSGRSIETVRNLWREVCREARLRDIRLHDLRHSYASYLTRSGATLQLVQEALGHARIETTMRYSHTMPDDAAAAATSVGNMIAAAGNPKAEVIKMRRGRK